MDQNNAKGKNFLKVTGILMIIGGAISMIAMIIALIAIGAADALTGGIATASTENPDFFMLPASSAFSEA